MSGVSHCVRGQGHSQGSVTVLAWHSEWPWPLTQWQSRSGSYLDLVRSVTAGDADFCGEEESKLLLRHRLGSFPVGSLDFLYWLKKSRVSIQNKQQWENRINIWRIVIVKKRKSLAMLYVTALYSRFDCSTNHIPEGGAGALARCVVFQNGGVVDHLPHILTGTKQQKQIHAIEKHIMCWVWQPVSVTETVLEASLYSCHGDFLCANLEPSTSF